MRVAKWGNSLAVRLPAEKVRQLGLVEGDDIDIMIEFPRRKAVTPEERKAAIERIKAMSWKLPPDWKFDREEANAR